MLNHKSNPCSIADQRINGTVVGGVRVPGRTSANMLSAYRTGQVYGVIPANGKSLNGATELGERAGEISAELQYDVNISSAYQPQPLAVVSCRCHGNQPQPRIDI